MTDNETDETDEDLTFRRRDVLKTVGAAGAIGAIGAETAAAKKPKEFIVGVKPGKAGVAKRNARSVKREIDFGPDIGEAVAGRWPEEALKGLENNPNVRYIEENGTMETHSHPAELQWGVDRVDAEVAHAAGDTGTGIDIAILDTGIDADHPDLQGNLGAGHSPEDCQDSFHPGNCANDWDDDDGHGTHVAGISDAIQNNDDVVGVSTQATLHAVKVCRQFIRTDGTTGTTCPNDSVASGITTAANQGYDVINMSLGACCPSCGTVGDGTGDCDDCFDVPSVIDDAIQTAKDNDVVIVASAGNDGNRPDCDGDGDRVCDDNDCVSTPAKHPDVIAVSSTEIDDDLSVFSSVGSEVDLAAPGTDIPSTWNNGGLNTISGTSMAAPHVTGAAAQLLADGTSPGSVRSELKNNAEDIGLPSYAQGAGLLDIADALGHNSANDLLEVETDFASGLDFTEATLNGTLTQLTGSDSATVGFEWGEQGAGLPNTEVEGTRSAPDNFDVTLTGLEEDTAYEFRAKATNAEGSTEFGTTETFSTVDNQDPTADITHSPFEPNPDQTVTFDGSGSFDGDGAGDSIVSYEWDLDDDGAFDDATGVTASRSYATGGSKTVGLRVTDEFDQTDTATHTFYVNMAPTASFTVSPDPVVRDEPATFDASGSSDPDGTVDLYEWDWDNDGTFEESTTSATTSHTFTTGGKHTVALRVTDNDGATSDPVTMTFTVHIRVAIDIEPNGSGPNSINPNRKGNVPVAVLHTSAFDPPARLDHSTVRFGDPDDVGFDTTTDPFTPQGGATPAHPGGHVEDVDGDGDMDSLFHFPIPDADFDSADTEGELVGLTNDGVPVFGTDDVNIVGGGGP